MSKLHPIPPSVKEWILAEVHPIIDRVSEQLKGAYVATAAFALLNLTVTYWRRTGFSDSDLHEALDEVLETADQVAAERRAAAAASGN